MPSFTGVLLAAPDRCSEVLSFQTGPARTALRRWAETIILALGQKAERAERGDTRISQESQGFSATNRPCSRASVLLVSHCDSTAAPRRRVSPGSAGAGCQVRDVRTVV